MKIKVFDQSGKAGKDIEVSSAVFDVALSPPLISQVVQTQLANRRRAIAHTKDRGEVSGGGRKPWRQKGTGSARAGSSRSPLWRGGGITFGPRNTRNYQKRLPHKMAAKALKMALSEKAKDKKIIVVSSFSFEKASTSQMQDFLEALPIEEGKILIVLSKTNVNLELSAANLKYLKTVLVDGLNLVDILNYDYLVTDKDGVKAIEKRFLKNAKRSKAKNGNSH